MDTRARSVKQVFGERLHLPSLLAKFRDWIASARLDIICMLIILLIATAFLAEEVAVINVKGASVQDNHTSLDGATRMDGLALVRWLSVPITSPQPQTS